MAGNSPHSCQRYVAGPTLAKCGPGRENVLTTEVFAALDFLPRDAFLGNVIRNARAGTEAVKSTVAAVAEDAWVTVLPGDIQPRFRDGTPTSWRVQPDVLIESDDVCCLVAAKRIRPSSFQRDQLLRTLLALRTRADGRTPLLLLVLGQPPPIAVAGAGRLDPSAAVAAGLAASPDDERASLTELAAHALVSRAQRIGSDRRGRASRDGSRS
jgi:hypothetical protein